MLLQVLDGSQFHRVLLRIVRLRILVFDKHMSIDLKDSLTLFYLGIIPPQGNWTSLFSNEITVDVRKLPFGFHTIYIDDMGFQTKENLGTCVTMVKTFTIGKNGICRGSFIKPVCVQVRYSGLDVFPHGISNDHLGQLSSIVQSGFDDFHRSIT